MSVASKAWCGDCRSNQIVEELLELEERPASGPEWACTTCGAAWLDLVPYEVVGQTRGRAVG